MNDSAAMSPARLLITDIDNTLFNWVDYFGPSFRSMIHMLSRTTEIDEATLTENFQQVYDKFGTTEYSFALQHLKVLHGVPQDRLAELIDRSMTSFGRTRRKYMHPYPGVRETLRELHTDGVFIVAATNAPLYTAWSKLKRLGLSRFFIGIAAWEGYQADEDDSVGRSLSLASKQALPEYTWPIHRRDLKPSREMYHSIMQSIPANPESTWVVGDSMRNDIGPALSLGLNALWAVYGLTFSEKNLRTVQMLTPGGPAEVKEVYSQETKVLVPALKEFAEILRAVPLNQERLF